MRFVSTSFATLLALVAFGPTRTMVEEPGGSQDKGHPGGARPSVVQPSVEQRPGEQHETVSTETHREAAAAPGRTGDAEKDSSQSAAARVNPQSSQRAGAAATPESWRYRSHNGRWWYWTPQNRWMWYGDNGQWTDYNAETYPNTANAYVVDRPILASPLPEAKFSGSPITITNPATSKVTISYTLDCVAYTIPPGYSQELREDRAWVIQFCRGTNVDQARYRLQSGLYTFTSTDHGWELYRSDLP